MHAFGFSEVVSVFSDAEEWWKVLHAKLRLCIVIDVSKDVVCAIHHIMKTLLTVCRHDVTIQQGGEQTSTTLRHFLLCGAGQVHDLHTSLVLDHPDGKADQLHKCIVSDASGHGLFDGNVQVRCPARSCASNESWCSDTASVEGSTGGGIHLSMQMVLLQQAHSSPDLFRLVAS